MAHGRHMKDRTVYALGSLTIMASALLMVVFLMATA